MGILYLPVPPKCHLFYHWDLFNLIYFIFYLFVYFFSEANDDSGPKTSEAGGIPAAPVSEKGSVSAQTTNVDEEGFSVRPQESKPTGDDNSFDSSSDTDSGR